MTVAFSPIAEGEAYFAGSRFFGGRLVFCGRTVVPCLRRTRPLTSLGGLHLRDRNHVVSSRGSITGRMGRQCEFASGVRRGVGPELAVGAQECDRRPLDRLPLEGPRPLRLGDRRTFGRWGAAAATGQYDGQDAEQ